MVPLRRRRCSKPIDDGQRLSPQRPPTAGHPALQLEQTTRSRSDDPSALFPVRSVRLDLVLQLRRSSERFVGRPLRRPFRRLSPSLGLLLRPLGPHATLLILINSGHAPSVPAATVLCRERVRSRWGVCSSGRRRCAGKRSGARLLRRRRPKHRPIQTTDIPRWARKTRIRGLVPQWVSSREHGRP